MWASAHFKVKEAALLQRLHGLQQQQQQGQGAIVDGVGAELVVAAAAADDRGDYLNGWNNVFNAAVLLSYALASLCMAVFVSLQLSKIIKSVDAQAVLFERLSQGMEVDEVIRRRSSLLRQQQRLVAHNDAVTAKTQRLRTLLLKIRINCIVVALSFIYRAILLIFSVEFFTGDPSPACGPCGPCQTSFMLISSWVVNSPYWLFSLFTFELLPSFVAVWSMRLQTVRDRQHQGAQGSEMQPSYF
jgi:hypothetical protein